MEACCAAVRTQLFHCTGAVLGLVGALAVGACATLARTPYTASDAALAEIPGIPEARKYADAPAASFRFDAASSFLRLRRQTPLNYLALSGGGDNGAYGAGVLNGLTEAGTRPEFTVVSGVSTGALIAPFAFLGPSYDARLREAYTSGLAETLLESPDPLSLVFASSLFSSRRLREFIARYADDAMLAAIAAEHAKGRRLFVATTDLDSQRAAIWDMGRIASANTPDSLSLFRDVLAASASVPAVFPPVLIAAEANGNFFREMHVDGSVMQPVFTMPDAFLLGSVLPLRRRALNMYVLMNNKIEPDLLVVPNKTVDVAGRTASTTIKVQTRSVLFGTYAFARRNGFGFNLTYIDKDVPPSTSAGFDTAYMRALYRYGYEKARSGRVWVSSIPSDTLVLVRNAERLQ
jgi:hypothetical protein